MSTPWSTILRLPTPSKDQTPVFVTTECVTVPVKTCGQVPFCGEPVTNCKVSLNGKSPLRRSELFWAKAALAVQTNTKRAFLRAADFLSFVGFAIKQSFLT